MTSAFSSFATSAPLSNGTTHSRDPSPNRGFSIPSKQALHFDGLATQSQAVWKEQAKIDESKQIRLVKLSHMRYVHTDLKEITQFLRDFGMQVVKKSETKVWYGGYGPDPYVYYAEKGPEKKFLGGCFMVETYADLEIAANIPGATAIEELTESPGGGHSVTVFDPEGFPVNLIYGQEPAKPGPLPEKLVYNFEGEKPREDTFQRFRHGPAAVHKLGHFGLCVADFPAQVAFYTRHFNLVPSDFLHHDDDDEDDTSTSAGKKKVALFAHIDRGEDYVDHHTFFMSSNPTSHVHHCSFEVHDFDTQLLGHQWLASKKYKSVWGVGRHILGSQIFDYWWDTSGFMIEHYADGDRVNSSTPIGYGPAGDESLAVWGPEVPKSFLE